MLDWISPQDLVYVVLSIVKCAAVVGAMLTFVPLAVVAERRVSALIQDRVGPNRVGIPLTKIRFWGLGQPIADALKFLLKEEFTPAGVNKFYFLLAPTLAMAPALITVAVIPWGSSIDLRPIVAALGFGKDWSPATMNAFNVPGVVANVDVGILFVFAIVSISVYGIVLAGWASNSKFPFLGGIRSSAQMISYELSMGLAVVPVLMYVGQLNLGAMVQHQINYGWLVLPIGGGWQSWAMWIPFVFSFIIFLISAFAETNRLPFDLPEAETELVGGYHTEYSAMKFALFFLGEYAAMIVVSALMVTVFFGGWSLPLPWFNGQPVPETWHFMAGAAMPAWFGLIHIGVFLAKLFCFIIFFIWVRWTLPRFRYDQLMSLGWKYMIPLAFANVFLSATIMLVLKLGGLTL